MVSPKSARTDGAEMSFCFSNSVARWRSPELNWVQSGYEPDRDSDLPIALGLIRRPDSGSQQSLRHSRGILFWFDACDSYPSTIIPIALRQLSRIRLPVMNMVKGVTVVSLPFDCRFIRVWLPSHSRLIAVSSLSHFTTPLDGTCHRDTVDQPGPLLCLVRRIVC